MVFGELRQQEKNSNLFICFFVEKTYGKKSWKFLLLQTFVEEKKLPDNNNI